MDYYDKSHIVALWNLVKQLVVSLNEDFSQYYKVFGRSALKFVSKDTKEALYHSLYNCKFQCHILYVFLCQYRKVNMMVELWHFH